MKKRFPQYLSAPFQVLFLESDEMVIFMVCFTLAMIFGNIFWLTLIAGPYFYSMAKKRNPRGFFRHILYFFGITEMKGYPSYFEKEFYE
jgi:type IV conjugative transfer system protein TraL